MPSNLFVELTKVTRDTFFGKHYELVKRNKDGMRWIRHRFPIKGGISQMDIYTIAGQEHLSRFKIVRND